MAAPCLHPLDAAGRRKFPGTFQNVGHPIRRDRRVRRTIGRPDMFMKAIGAAALLPLAAPAAYAQAPNDAQIAHLAYTADSIDIAAGKQALAKSQNKAVRDFAQEMVRDHTAEPF